MGSLTINSIYYEGKKYVYENKNFKQGLNIIKGDNGNGKSTFTYLVIYALGMDVKFLSHRCKEPIKEIIEDTENFVELEISIRGERFILKRFIGENYIIVKNVSENIYNTYNIFRKGIYYENENKNFSDWICSELGIQLEEITQFSATHKVNFDDLMRYMYYDQFTDDRKIINEFSVSSSDFFRNSDIMKRIIFESLMTTVLSEYYSLYYKIKKDAKQLEIQKEELMSFKTLQSNILHNLNIEEDNILIKRDIAKKELLRIEHIRSNIQEEKYFGEESGHRLVELQQKIVANTYKIINLETQLQEYSNMMNKSKSARYTLSTEINHLHKILFTAQYIDIISQDKCPFCQDKIDMNQGNCICGSDKHLDFSRFIYTDKEYKDLIKTKMKGLKTIDQTIQECEKKCELLKQHIRRTKDDMEVIVKNIKQLSKSAGYHNCGMIDELTSKIILLKEEIHNLDIVIAYSEEIISKQNKVHNKKKEIEKAKEKLDLLQEEKDNILQKNINIFEENYTKYLNDFYETQDLGEIKLDRNYMPVMKHYKEQSFTVPKRVFYYLTLLKMSLRLDLNYPKFLIMDTFKSGGIEIDDLKRLLKKLLEFNEGCQLIVTVGYDEYMDVLDPYLIESLSDDDKLLKPKN